MRCWLFKQRLHLLLFFFFQAEDGIRDVAVTGVQTCALPISLKALRMAKPISKQLVVCINNEGYPVSLEKRKIYISLRDPLAEKRGLLRIIRSEERRVGKSVDLGGRRIIKKKKKKK